MKTGNTALKVDEGGEGLPASMEPGHEDREYRASKQHPATSSARLNGARS